MNEITLDHIRKAAEWAKIAIEPTALDGEIRQYNQSNWDCGTSCCMWGAAHLIAGNGKCNNGPPNEWATTAQHKLVIALLRSGTTMPDQVLSVLDNADLRGADLRGADLRCADLRDANLRCADLRCADLRDAVISISNVYCTIK